MRRGGENEVSHAQGFEPNPVTPPSLTGKSKVGGKGHPLAGTKGYRRRHQVLGYEEEEEGI